MEILYVILGIILIIAIMALTGYYLEKKQKNIIEKDNNINIIFDEVNAHKNANAASNAEIPEVLNFNEIEEYENKKEQSEVNSIQFDVQDNNLSDVNNNVNVIQFDEPVKLDNEQVQEEVPLVLDLTENNVVDQNNETDVNVENSVGIPEIVSEEVPAILDLNSSEIDGKISESIEITEEISEPVQEESIVLDLNSSEVENNDSESIEITEESSEPVQEEVVIENETEEPIPVEEPVKKNKKAKNKSKKNEVIVDEVSQDIIVDGDSITIPDNF